LNTLCFLICLHQLTTADDANQLSLMTYPPL
jgi:hypothetical protein